MAECICGPASGLGFIPTVVAHAYVAEHWRVDCPERAKNSAERLDCAEHQSEKCAALERRAAMQSTDTIRIKRVTSAMQARPITEEEFRKLLGATLISLSTTGTAEYAPPEVRTAMLTVGEFLHRNDPTGAPEDFSILATFMTMPQLVSFMEEEAV